ncbi:embryogenesis-associated protein EMB8-like isoform X4 [Punica granatum]|uniref:Embryogenesis-associated protein EMB8-like isoform X4 n=1 Tax=Punica granatum TaxID=22663 RepID=A0A6P8CRT9_PUNGR|nr:embryogenesis-associated protein EMB8-like isoform X4 [Punica granatum]
MESLSSPEGMGMGICYGNGSGSGGAYSLLLTALSLIPASHYLYALCIVVAVFVYAFLEFHFIEDVLFTGLRGCSVRLTYNPLSKLYQDVVSNCSLLHGRYLATPWLSSPHVQTAFLNYFGKPPMVSYTREIFAASDGGNIALDWLASSYGHGNTVNDPISKEGSTPIVVVIPGLMSESSAAYIKHLVFHMAKKRRWNVVVSNHRGQGGISVTTDCFYNAGWTEDVRAVVNHLSREYPMAPLYIVGTSVGANILVKYLGEDGENVPVAGAVAVCSPWDLLIGDRFIGRKLVQKFYDRAIASGLQRYAFLHVPFEILITMQPAELDNLRRCSSANYIGNVSVPLLCISALDDPVCSREAIPWDECRLNSNVVLATTKHGGHLAFFEGLAGSSLWWVRASDEFLDNLETSRYLHLQKKAVEVQKSPGPHTAFESLIDQGPYVNVSAGMVAPMVSESDQPCDGSAEISTDSLDPPSESGNGTDAPKERKPAAILRSEQGSEAGHVVSPFRRCLDLILGQSRRPIWLLAHVALLVTWPMVGSALRVLLARKLRKDLPAPPIKR